MRHLLGVEEWSRRLKSGFRRWRLRDLQIFAETAGLFDAAWYREILADELMPGSDPFVHYMRRGWRVQIPPAERIEIESVAARYPGFRLGVDNPIRFLFVRRSASSLSAESRASPAMRVEARLPRTLADGLCVTGYLRSEIGLGQAARNLVRACDAVRLPVSCRALRLPGLENEREFESKCVPVADRKANLIVGGLPSVEIFLREAAPGRLNIFYPFWEVDTIRPEWNRDIRAFDEIWAPSRFVASLFRDLAGVTVRFVPQPVRLRAQVPQSRPDRSTLRFFTFLDYASYAARKNPEAAVNAFRAAFPPARRDVELVVKTRGERDSGRRRWLMEAASQDDRIRVMDQTVDRMGMDALMRDCDAFISLHRSEGFGFGPAEALAAGKAVVATDYGGTTDFISEATGYPVAYEMVPVGPEEYPGAEGHVWASPSHEAAVAALRAIDADFSGAEARARCGFERLRSSHSPVVVGSLIADILAGHGLVRPWPFSH
ncbi:MULTISPECIES: glycosyltransferase [unclassified Mesorhizobium]|uniref:glycosyltransferase n=1 Tax=unclassified Mesorhizobium TaxID=325217 RepID=UPI0015E431D7|nr:MULTISPECIES: glycosyltransferase [unclassified Mesorhizobium]